MIPAMSKSSVMDRFLRDAPLYCGNEFDPGINEVPDWRDWTDRDTTPDQARIERFLELHGVAGKTLLHVGIGNSSLAKRYCVALKKCIGLSITTREVQFAKSLGLSNYVPLEMNKYSLAFHDMPLEVDIIVDNNPASYACCSRHLSRMLEAYSGKLAPGGIIVSDRAGLRFVSSANETPDVWRMSIEDWASITLALGLSTSTPDGDVTVSSRPFP